MIQLLHDTKSLSFRDGFWGQIQPLVPSRGPSRGPGRGRRCQRGNDKLTIMAACRGPGRVYAPAACPTAGGSARRAGTVTEPAAAAVRLGDHWLVINLLRELEARSGSSQDPIPSPTYRLCYLVTTADRDGHGDHWQFALLLSFALFNRN
jgi:hypothetical protein